MHRLNGLPHFLQQLHRDQRGEVNFQSILVFGLIAAGLLIVMALAFPIVILLYKLGFGGIGRLFRQWMTS